MPLTPEQREQLENEVIMGTRAQTSYDNFISQFVEDKKALLYESFKTVSIRDADDILGIKRMCQVIDNLDGEILQIIETGRLAAITLAESPGP